MRSLPAVPVTLFFLITLNPLPGNSQVTNVRDSTALRNAVSVYHNILKPETGLYVGSEYPYRLDYPVKLSDSDPFFETTTFDQGDLHYNGMLYENVPMLYDVVQGEVLIKDPSGIYIIRLNNSKVDWFKLHNMIFQRLVKDSNATGIAKTGYYTTLVNGKVSLYKLYSKQIKESPTTSSGLRVFADPNDEYYLKKEGNYFRLNSSKSVFKVLSDKRKDISRFMKKNKLRLRKTPDYALMKIVSYYNSIAKN